MLKMYGCIYFCVILAVQYTFAKRQVGTLRGKCLSYRSHLKNNYSVLWCPLRCPNKTMLGSFLPPVVCRRAHVLFTLFVFVYIQWCLTHIVLCFCFVCLRLVYPLLSFSQDYFFSSVFFNVYLYIINKVKQDIILQSLSPTRHTQTILVFSDFTFKLPGCYMSYFVIMNINCYQIVKYLVILKYIQKFGLVYGV